MSKAKSVKDSVDFEAALKELNQLVEEMEQGGLSLEQSLQRFERGITLTRTCQAALKAAEQRIQILVEQNGQAALKPFEDEAAE